jgi:hypothetical protein
MLEAILVGVLTQVALLVAQELARWLQGRVTTPA